MYCVKIKFKAVLFVSLILTAIWASRGFADDDKVAQGIVFEDKNNNSVRDKGEKPVANVPVSNGINVVLTDKNGRYRLPVKDETIIFVIKPAGWNVRTDKLNIPRFYYIHNPQGSPNLQFRGVEPTGQLPKSIDFPLYKSKESEKFDVVMFGDPQISNDKELGYFEHDAIEEVAGSKAAFGIMLGDIVFDNPDMFEGINRAVSLIGITWYSLPGNHDMNYDAGSDEYSLETYKRVYGPSYYAFNYGQVHFIVLDSIIAKTVPDNNWLQYDEGLTDEQLEFVKNDLAFVSRDKLIVVMGHANFTEFKKNKKELLDVLSRYRYTLSIAGHDHRVENIFLKSADGWNGREPHHIYVAGATCGAWWYGLPTEENIPNAMMTDGSPNGYSVISFNKNKYSIRYKGFGKDMDYQMTAYMPDEITLGEVDSAEILLNIFTGSEKNIVEMKVDAEGKWNAMEQKSAQSPYFLLAVAEEEKYGYQRPDWNKNPCETTHIWKGKLPENLSEGTHIVYFRSTDMYGRKYTAKRVFRVKAEVK